MKGGEKTFGKFSLPATRLHRHVDWPILGIQAHNNRGLVEKLVQRPLVHRRRARQKVQAVVVAKERIVAAVVLDGVGGAIGIGAVQNDVVGRRGASIR